MARSLRNVDTRTGLKIIHVSGLAELDAIDAKTQGIIISGRLGERKRADILKAATEKKITILNIKDVDAYLKKREDAREEKKAKKQQRAKKKADNKKEKKSVEEEVEAAKEETDEEEKKKEQEKILHHKQ
jgi:hypothetical protein